MHPASFEILMKTRTIHVAENRLEYSLDVSAAIYLNYSENLALYM